MNPRVELVLVVAAGLVAGPGLEGDVDPQPVRADEIVVANFKDDQKLPPEPWRLEVHRGEPDLSYVREETGQALRLRSGGASSYAIQRRVDVDLDRTPYLVWDWKVTILPQSAHFADPSKADQAAQLILAFDDDLFGSAQVIAYIWGSTAARGKRGETPTGEQIPLLDMKAIVVESGAEKTGHWRTEARNVVKDYTRLFNEPPVDPVGIRIQINSQHTNGRAESLWRTIRFTDQPKGGPPATP